MSSDGVNRLHCEADKPKHVLLDKIDRESMQFYSTFGNQISHQLLNIIAIRTIGWTPPEFSLLGSHHPAIFLAALGSFLMPVPTAAARR